MAMNEREIRVRIKQLEMWAEASFSCPVLR
jgi:hypothetical protein